MLYSNEKKEITIIYNSMDRSQKHPIKQKSNTKENVIYDSIYITFRKVTLISNVRNQYPWGLEGAFWETGHILFLDLGAGYMGVFIV